MHVGLVEAILAACADFMWETSPRGPGLRVWNSHTNEWVTIWIVLIRLIEDSAGLPKPMCCHKHPAFIGTGHDHATRAQRGAHTAVFCDDSSHHHPLLLTLTIDIVYNIIRYYDAGACPWCDVLGVWIGNTTVYPGALALVPTGSSPRKLWETYQPGEPINDEASSDSEGKDEDSAPPPRRNLFNAHVNATITRGITRNTTTGAYASGRRALRLSTKRARKKEPFFAVSVYAKLFPGINQYYL